MKLRDFLRDHRTLILVTFIVTQVLQMLVTWNGHVRDGRGPALAAFTGCVLFFAGWFLWSIVNQRRREEGHK